MKGPRKPTRHVSYILQSFVCPYCGEVYTSHDIDRHLKKCFRRHRKEVRRIYAERAKRTFEEGKTLKHIPRKKKEES